MAKGTTSHKAPIIEAIFESLWDPANQKLKEPRVSYPQIKEQIALYNAKNEGKSGLPSVDNPANFFKDFTRRRKSANLWWPNSVFVRGYTARQLVGDKLSFEFVPVRPGQTEPFPVTVPLHTDQTPRHRITSAVLPDASRRLGRSDEPWLIQVAVKLRVVETHLSLFSPRRNWIRQVDHLQNTLKLRKSEIDAVFLVTEEREPGQSSELMVTCEVKRSSEDLNMDQLLRQPVALFDAVKTVDVVIPFGIRSVGKSLIHVVEFEAISRADAEKIGNPKIPSEEQINNLTIQSDAVYEIFPIVPGIR